MKVTFLFEFLKKTIFRKLREFWRRTKCGKLLGGGKLLEDLWFRIFDVFFMEEGICQEEILFWNFLLFGFLRDFENERYVSYFSKNFYCAQLKIMICF